MVHHSRMTSESELIRSVLRETLLGRFGTMGAAAAAAGFERTHLLKLLNGRIGLSLDQASRLAVVAGLSLSLSIPATRG